MSASTDGFVRRCVGFRCGARLLAVAAAALAFFSALGALPQTTWAAGPWYVAPTGNNLNDCLSPATACLTISAAITKASPADTINVAAGTYAGNITINKSLTVVGDPGDASPGPGGSAPVIDGGSVAGSAFFIANDVSDVTIKGFEMRNFTSNDNGVGNGISAWVGHTSNISIEDNYFHDLGYNGVLVGNDKNADPVKWRDHDNWTIKKNILETFEAYGFELTNASNSRIEDNIIHSNATWNLAATCIMVDARRNESGIVISGNQLDGEMWPLYSAIYVFANSFEVANVNLDNVLIDENIVSTTSSTGTPQVRVYRYPGTGSVTNARVNGNSLLTLKNDKHVTNTAPLAVLDAAGNWWGTNTSAGVAGAVSANVDYTPWLDGLTDTSGNPGFQGDFSVLDVDDDSPQSGAVGRIQEGINLVSGSTVNVAAGTYDESLNIVGRTGLTINGADKTTVTIKPTTPTTLACWDLGYLCTRKAAVRVVDSTDVVLQNVTLDLDLVKANRVYGLLFWNSTGTVNNNIIKNLSVSDLDGGYTEIGSYYRAPGPGYSDTARAHITLSDNTLIDTGRVGILTHDFVDMTITGNTIYKTTADFGYAMEIGSASTAMVTGNTIYGYDTPALSDGSISGGIYVENAFTELVVSPISKNVAIADNEIYGSQWALYVGNEFDGYAGDVDIDLSLTGNNFHDNLDGAAAITDEDRAAGSSVTVTGSGNTLSNNGDYGYLIYTWGDGDVTVDLSGETITGHASTGIHVQDFASGASGSSYNVSVKLSDVRGNPGDGVYVNVPDTTLTAAVLTCNRIVGNGNGIVSANSGVTATENKILGNVANGINGSAIASGTMNGTDNWWGCVAGPGNLGCDTVTGSVDVSPWATAVPVCVICLNNADCNDGSTCTGSETCIANACVRGTPVVCSDQCETGTCLEPTGTCEPKPNGTTCSLAPACSVPDTCQSGACTLGAGGEDGDSDTVCDADDNCPAVANSGQEDLDGDDIGNVCDDSDGELNVVQAKLRRASSATHANGSVKLKGDFYAPAPDSFGAASGITIAAADDLGFTISHTWASGECVTSGTGRVTCKSADKNFQGKFGPFTATPNVFRFNVTFKKQAIDSTRVFVGPVKVRLIYNGAPVAGIDRVGTIIDCKAIGSGLSCRNF